MFILKQILKLDMKIAAVNATFFFFTEQKNRKARQHMQVKA